MPATPFADWRDSTPKLWARFTSPKYPQGIYHAFYSLLSEPLPENQVIIPQSACGMVYEEHVVPEPDDFWPPVGMGCRRCVNSVTTQNRRAIAAKVGRPAVKPRQDDDGAPSPATTPDNQGTEGPE